MADNPLLNVSRRSLIRVAAATISACWSVWPAGARAIGADQPAISNRRAGFVLVADETVPDQLQAEQCRVFEEHGCVAARVRFALSMVPKASTVATL